MGQLTTWPASQFLLEWHLHENAEVPCVGQLGASQEHAIDEQDGVDGRYAKRRMYRCIAAEVERSGAISVLVVAFG